ALCRTLYRVVWCRTLQFREQFPRGQDGDRLRYAVERSSASPPDAHTPRSSPSIAARRSGSTISTEAGGIAEPRYSFPKIRRHAMPCHHNVDKYLIDYLNGDGLGDDPEGRCSARWAAAPASSRARS